MRGSADAAFGIAGLDFTAAGLAADGLTALAGAALAADFACVGFAAGLAEIGFLAVAGFAEALAAGLAAALAAGCLDAAGFAADFAEADFAGLAAADFAGAGFAAVLAVVFIVDFEAAGFKVLPATGFAAVLFVAVETGLAVAFACFAGRALAGFAAPVLVGSAGLGFTPADLDSDAAAFLVILANCASLVFPLPDYCRLQPFPSQLFCPPGKCRENEPKTILPTMYCDKVAARKPCLRVSSSVNFAGRAGSRGLAWRHESNRRLARHMAAERKALLAGSFRCSSPAKKFQNLKFNRKKIW